MLLSWVALCFSTAQLMSLPHPRQVCLTGCIEGLAQTA